MNVCFTNQRYSGNVELKEPKYEMGSSLKHREQGVYRGENYVLEKEKMPRFPFSLLSVQNVETW